MWRKKIINKIIKKVIKKKSLHKKRMVLFSPLKFQFSVFFYYWNRESADADEFNFKNRFLMVLGNYFCR